MSVTSERLLNALGKLAGDPEVKALLRDLDLPEQAAKIEDGVSSDYEAPNHGVAVFFRTAYHLRKLESFRTCPPETPIVSDVLFSRKGFSGGPGFSGALPQGLAFSETRDAVRTRLGPPSSTSPLGSDDRWDDGDRYMTLAFYIDEAKGFWQVSCGLHWTL